jgi:hypothetical protein
MDPISIASSLWKTLFPPPEKTVVVVGTNRKLINQLVREKCNISIGAEELSQFQLRHFDLSLYCYHVKCLSAKDAMKIVELIQHKRELRLPSTWYLIVSLGHLKTFLPGAAYQQLTDISRKLHFEIKFVTSENGHLKRLPDNRILEELTPKQALGRSLTLGGGGDKVTKKLNTETPAEPSSRHVITDSGGEGDDDSLSQLVGQPDLNSQESRSVVSAVANSTDVEPISTDSH